MSTINDYTRLSYLGDKVKAGSATKAETDEFMKIIYENGKITKIQYDDYVSNRNTQDIVDAALAVGAIWLIGSLLSELFKGSK